MDINSLTVGQLKEITPVERRFWSLINKEPNGCYQWLGDKYGNGYGRIQINGIRMSAHRLGYMLGIGSIPAGHIVHHKCTNKLCVNPDHLESMTVKQNTRAYYNGNGDGW